jgi:hypothetical protein
MKLDKEIVHNSGFDNEEISIIDIITKIKNILPLLKFNWKLILATSIFGGLIGFSITFLVSPSYKAVLTYAMEEDRNSSSGIGGALGLASSLGIDLNNSNGGGAFAASNISALMKSHLIINKVLLQKFNINGKTLTLADYYIQIKNKRKKWKNYQKLKNINFSRIQNSSNLSFEQDSLLKEFYKDLTQKENLDIIQRDKKVTIVEVQVNSESELFAKLFCEAIANQTSEFYVATKSKKARINTEILQRQVDSVRDILNKNIFGVAKAADDVYNLNPTLNVRSAKSKKIQVDVTANTEVLKQLIVQLELSKINLRKETPLIQLIDRPTLPLEIDKLNKAYTVFLSTLLFTILSIIYLLKIKSRIN